MGRWARTARAHPAGDGAAWRLPSNAASGEGILARGVAPNHPQGEDGGDLAPGPRLEPHRHAGLSTDQFLRNPVLDIEEPVRVGEAERLVGYAPTVDLNLELRRRAAPVATVVGREQDHRMRGIDGHVVGEPARASPSRAPEDTLRHHALASLIVEPTLEDDFAGLEIRHRGRFEAP